MTRPTDPPPLADALGIPGASAVSLLDPDGPRVLWWAGGGPPDEQQAATVVTLAAAAAGMVMLGETGDELGDVLLTSSDAFHVVRLVEDDTAPLVAHLTLRRAGANLAMARREFGSLIKAYAGKADQTTAATAPALAAPSTAPEAETPAELPRRNRVAPPPADESPDLFGLLGQPYTADDDVLDRVLNALRSL
ncbi:hypothetical protein [Actinoplanes sp. NPDC048796]|uniref:hypothetical protein n=1 Tax=unclassified Actinoplanes TaxID=2626549 RepID=UPI00340C6498